MTESRKLLPLPWQHRVDKRKWNGSYGLKEHLIQLYIWKAGFMHQSTTCICTTLDRQ